MNLQYICITSAGTVVIAQVELSQGNKKWKKINMY